MLGNAIALLTMALMLASEAKRAQPPASYGLWTLGTVVALVALGLGPITDAAPAVGALLTHIFREPMAWFILLVALFFVLRPFWTAKSETSGPEIAAFLPYDAVDDDIYEQMNEQLGRVEAAQTNLVHGHIQIVDAAKAREARIMAIIEDYQRMLGLEARFTEFCDKIAPKVASLTADTDGLRGASVAHSELIRETKEAVESMRSGVQSLHSGLLQRLDWIDHGFAAIYDRERLNGLAASIEELGDKLSTPTSTGAAVEDWAAWQGLKREWRKQTEAWARLAESYRVGTFQRVFDLPEAEYQGKWKATDDLFPDSTAVLEYRTFRIILKNFWRELPYVNDGVRLAAFASPSMKGPLQ